MKFKAGDRVKIINSFCGHHFKIGEEVIIAGVSDKYENYTAKNGVEEWNVIEAEVEQATNKDFNYCPNCGQKIDWSEVENEI